MSMVVGTYISVVATSGNNFIYETDSALASGDVVQFSRQVFTQETNIDQEIEELQMEVAANRAAIGHSILDEEHQEFLQRTTINDDDITATRVSELNRRLAPPVDMQSIYQLGRDVSEFPTATPTFAQFIADKRNFAYRLPTGNSELRVQADNPVQPTGTVELIDLVRYRNNAWEFLQIIDATPDTTRVVTRHLNIHGNINPRINLGFMNAPADSEISFTGDVPTDNADVTVTVTATINGRVQAARTDTINRSGAPINIPIETGVPGANVSLDVRFERDNTNQEVLTVGTINRADNLAISNGYVNVTTSYEATVTDTGRARSTPHVAFGSEVNNAAGELVIGLNDSGSTFMLYTDTAVYDTNVPVVATVRSNPASFITGTDGRVFVLDTGINVTTGIVGTLSNQAGRDDLGMYTTTHDHRTVWRIDAAIEVINPDTDAGGYILLGPSDGSSSTPTYTNANARAANLAANIWTTGFLLPLRPMEDVG